MLLQTWEGSLVNGQNCALLITHQSSLTLHPKMTKDDI